MSKLGKLMKNPRQFFVDSRLRRMVLSSAHQLNQRLGTRPLNRRPAFEPRSGPEAAAQNDWTSALVKHIAARVPTLLVPEQEAGSGMRLGVRRMDQQLLTAALTDLAMHSDVRLTIRGARKASFVAAPRRLFALDNFLTRQKGVSVRVVRTVLDQLEKATLNFEFWEHNGLHWTAPRRNPIARRLSCHTIETEGLFRAGKLYDVRELLSFPPTTHNGLEIDIVYTWVNHEDPKWRALYAEAVGDEAAAQINDATSLDRFLSRDELRYSLRSVAMHAPWIRRVHIVSNCSPPEWLDLSHPKLRWVDHSEIFSQECLPTFSSHAIEARLQHVPDLSEHFLYFNDDFFLSRRADPSDFFFPNGIAKAFMEEYGVVNGEVHPEDPDYLNAARNGQRLIEQRFGRTPTALHKHTPYALRKSVLFEMEESFADPYQRTSSGKFRGLNDISTVSFLHHHYAYLTGRSMYAARSAVLLKPASARYLDEMLRIMDGSTKPLSICINDGQGSAHDRNWNQNVRGFLDALFGYPSEFELVTASVANEATLTEPSELSDAETGGRDSLSTPPPNQAELRASVDAGPAAGTNDASARREPGPAVSGPLHASVGHDSSELN